MDLTTILPYSIFVAVTAGFWTASSLLLRRSTRTSARLDALRNPLLRQRRDPVLSAARMNAMSSLVEKAAPALSRALNPNPKPNRVCCEYDWRMPDSHARQPSETFSPSKLCRSDSAPFWD